jgi:hypothetical protein
MTPTINVNLTPCDGFCELPYHAQCSVAFPILIPCSLQFFRSVTFEVVLGECTSPVMCATFTKGAGHILACTNRRTIRVSCFIDGETWPETEVGEIDVHESQNPGAQDTERILAACRERWALVKALVLGAKWGTCPRDVDEIAKRHLNLVATLFNQRDALYAELTDLARDEQSAFGSQERAIKAMGELSFLPDNYHRAEPIARASASILARYIERLIEQVGVLG